MRGRAHNLLIFPKCGYHQGIGLPWEPTTWGFAKGPGDNLPKSVYDQGIGLPWEPRTWGNFPILVLEGRPKARVLGEPTFDKYGGSLGTQIIRLGTLLWDDFDVGHV